MKPTPTKQPWEQLPDETDTAYHRFSIYLELGPDRSLERVGQKMGKSRAYKKQLEKWSSKYDWVHRAGEYDSYTIRKSLENREEILDMLTAKVLNRAEDLLDELIDVAMHDGTEMAGEGMINVYSQKVKAIETALDRIGFVRQKEAPELDKPVNVNTYMQNIYNKIRNINYNKFEEENPDI